MRFTIYKPPPENRSKYCDDAYEEHFHEAAVMIACAEWLFSIGANEVSIFPDGQHLKQLNVSKLLTELSFSKQNQLGTTAVGGKYMRNEKRLIVNPKSGNGDIRANVKGVEYEFEAKGGIVNTNHPGQKSKLRRGLMEAVGQLMASERSPDRMIAVVPFHAETKSWASRLAPRCRAAGIGILLARPNGEFVSVG